ncbi:MAG TPA: glucosaminidase domain-containing protein [Acidimicrobiales bacterium]|jgi:hypothetical protein|nr:glucosaminidase domain-containing protein [Acidimicrobiales bacterium]
MGNAVKATAAALAVVLALLVPASAVSAQNAPPAEPITTVPAGPPPSVPPDLPVVTPQTILPTDPSAPPPEPVPVLPDPSPQVAVVMAKLKVLDLQRIVGLAQAILDRATVAEAKVRAARDAAQRDREAKRFTLTDAVTNAYVRGGIDGTSIEPETADEYVPAQSARLLAGSAIDRDQRLVQTADDRLRAADNALAAAQGRKSQAQITHDFAQSALDSANTDVTDARRLTSSQDVSPTVVGDPMLTADEIVAWYKAEGVVGYVAGVDLQTLAGDYLDEGSAEKVRGDVAFAQSIVETGAFTSPLTTHNNFAGIGACDTCATGFDFPSPLLGVRAQAQLLHAYADKSVRASNLANPAIGSDPDTLGVRGCCPTWNKLTGTWASDPNYGPKLMTVYLSMLQYTLTQRTQAAALALAAPPA